MKRCDLPRLVAHADWGMHPSKRWLARASLQLSGRYRALAPEPVGALEELLARLEGVSGVLLGVDFPIGLPRAYARCAGIEDFVALLTQFGDGRWRDFYTVAHIPTEICVTRPFYPHHAGGMGTVSRRQLLDGLGLADPDALRRRCDHATKDRRAASPLFWTLGPNQAARPRSAAGATTWRRRSTPGWTSRSGRFTVRSRS